MSGKANSIQEGQAQILKEGLTKQVHDDAEEKKKALGAPQVKPEIFNSVSDYLAKIQTAGAGDETAKAMLNEAKAQSELLKDIKKNTENPNSLRAKRFRRAGG